VGEKKKAHNGFVLTITGFRTRLEDFNSFPIFNGERREKEEKDWSSGNDEKNVENEEIRKDKECESENVEEEEKDTKIDDFFDDDLEKTNFVENGQVNSCKFTSLNNIGSEINEMSDSGTVTDLQCVMNCHMNNIEKDSDVLLDISVLNEKSRKRAKSDRTADVEGKKKRRVEEDDDFFD
jgi:hypothetical protein